MANNEENLIPFNELTEEEQRKLAQKGGKASVEARRKKKLIKDQFELLLSLPLKDEKAKKKLEALGIDPDNIDNQMAMIISMWQKALKGDVSAFNSIREVTGEKVERIEISKSTDEVINEVDQYINKKKK